MVSNAVEGEKNEEIENKDRRTAENKKGTQHAQVPLKTLYTNEDAALFYFFFWLGTCLRISSKLMLGLNRLMGRAGASIGATPIGSGKASRPG